MVTISSFRRACEDTAYGQPMDGEADIRTRNLGYVWPVKSSTGAKSVTPGDEGHVRPVFE